MSEGLRRFLRRIHLGLALGLVVTAYISYYLVGTIMHNYTLQKEISGLQVQINDLQLERDQLKYKIQYYQTDSYKEKEARAKLGLQAPGEGVVILPRSKEKPSEANAAKTTPPRRSNLQQWFDFLMGKAPANTLDR